MQTVLEQELKAYNEHHDELVGKAEGKFVLIRGTQILGTFDSKMDAIRQGYQQLGNVPFLVKHVLRVETPQNFVSNLLAI